ncbi:hypothetical protein BASA81_001113 [Batrachochytrium salamandrivorans]|nr:hypothetical protein BASA81_001113 [Batrachochytrium salamandrivorans]
MCAWQRHILAFSVETASWFVLLSCASVQPTKQTSMHIVSWNVAGWTKALGEIRKHCKSLEEFMQRHEIDILCLQEVKGNLAKLESAESQQLFAAKEPGLDSFFAMCTSNSEGGMSGFNGVATFARKKLTLKADPAPLKAAEVDSQGRCIVTDHGEFVLFNVYAPYDGQGFARLRAKMHFLTLLDEAMAEWKLIKPVVLVGDLNLKRRLLDSCVENRRVDLNLLGEQQAPTGVVQRLKHVLFTQGGLLILKQCLSELETEEFGQPVDKSGTRKLRVFARHPTTRERKRINPGELWHPQELAEFVPFAERSSEDLVAVGENSPLLGELRMLTELLLDFKWTDLEFNQLGECADLVFAGARCTTDWIKSLSDLQDSFLVANGPNTSERFTVWNTRTNQRYSNAGSRLDYVLVDKRLTIQPNSNQQQRLFGCDCLTDLCAKPKRCGWQASTAFGRWQPAPMQGGGLPEATTADFNSQFRPKGGAHTGILYTPPGCSDHVAVSCVLSPSPSLQDLVLDNKDSGTKLARPYAKQRSLMDFAVITKRPRAA